MREFGQDEVSMLSRSLRRWRRSAPPASLPRKQSSRRLHSSHRNDRRETKMLAGGRRTSLRLSVCACRAILYY